jgi:hypothetical protein
MRRGLPAWPIFRFKTGLPAFWPWAPRVKARPWPGKSTIGAVQIISQKAKGKCQCIAGAGSNNTKEALSASRHAAEAGADAVLLVDPYYNGPSSLEIRKEYIAPVAAAFPDLTVIPYVIPGRTGAHLFPEDLALLFKHHPNVNTVKEATGNLDNMRRTRRCCGPEFTIFSGDDGLTVYEMMADPSILPRQVRNFGGVQHCSQGHERSGSAVGG